MSSGKRLCNRLLQQVVFSIALFYPQIANRLRIFWRSIRAITVRRSVYFRSTELLIQFGERSKTFGQEIELKQLQINRGDNGS